MYMEPVQPQYAQQAQQAYPMGMANSLSLFDQLDRNHDGTISRLARAPKGIS